VEEFRARQTLSLTPRKIPHPFLILTENPMLPKVNRLGFRDHDWPVAKTSGTIRIACIGASTTADGYPQLLQGVLRERLGHSRVEVLNFGNGYWTSAQHLINFALNVKYFSPDYVIFHEGANEMTVRGYREFRTDYAHAFNVLLYPPPRWDATLVRHYTSYALAKAAYWKARGLYSGVIVNEVLSKRGRQPMEPIAATELIAYRENLRDLITLARARQAKVILTTQPYSRTGTWSSSTSSSPDVTDRPWVQHMSQVNDVTRELASELGLPLIDLDAVMTGHEEYFRDPIHLKRNAIDIKVHRIAEFLAELPDFSRLGMAR
jgi:lysophospholipase L1-like esterase